MRIKVCGMTKAEQVKQLDELGVEFAGFIFYPKSPRYVFKSMPATEIKKIRGKINKVGVFVNADPDEVLKIVDACGLYLVQLHGDESPRVCERIANYVSVIKAFRISDDDNIEWKIREYYDAVDMYMFDTEGVGYGGTGKKFNWQLLRGQNIRKPFFLSGGISPDDAENLKTFQNDPVAKDLFAVDINSKFEIMPGVKDMDKVKEFVDKLKD
ncbi:phosphoribosylanthranilate isomerase [Panacibacter ginsenosidivorans]|uniref:N-(5'-phosphoribosyl)anthranilate isomerase n=1 Tax=Panacibacter ginsenosidivorans TaxID=1813871 RepID=A0A5B8V4T6_9BACT|nr:phosphoribosylanthranilate isomerase [Panacibacter ginsenosidivorans]QEC66209.1 phosphoribosylanthranilate isomerase [Panacibacter ginsenosidivorans]